MIDRLPDNIEAELLVLNACAYRASLIDDLIPLISAPDFSRPDNGEIWQVMCDLRGIGRSVDSFTVVTEMRKRWAGNTVAIDYVRSVLSVIKPGDPTTAAREVASAAMRRRLVSAANEMIRLAMSADVPDNDVIDQAERAVLAVRRTEADGNGLQQIGADVDSLVTELEDRGRDPGALRGVTTGFKVLDRYTQGLPPELILIGARPSMGKAQPLDAMILTPIGYRPMGEMVVGHRICGTDGKEYRVAAVHPQGIKDVYKVTMSDGTSTECCIDHLWFTQTRNERRRGCLGSVKNLAEILHTLNRVDGGKQNHALPMVQPVNFGSCILPLAPYALGLLIGDGCFRNGNIGFTNPEVDIVDQLRDELPCGDILATEKEGLQYRIKRSARSGMKPSATKQILKSLGLLNLHSHDKFIPYMFKFSSVSDRIELIKGLMDSDGYVCDSLQSVEYTTSSKRLAEDVAFVARSLGAIVSMVDRPTHYTVDGVRTECRTSWRLVLTFPSGLVPVSSKKHLAKWRGITGHKVFHRAIVSVEKVRRAECQCITVTAPNHLYITDGVIPTHNSGLLYSLILEVASRGKAVALFSLDASTKQVLERILGMEALVESWPMKTGQMRTDDWQRVRDFHKPFRGLPIYINDSLQCGVEGMASQIRRIKEPLGLVGLDYLQLAKRDAPGKNVVQEMGIISRSLKAICREFTVPVVALSQLSRKVEDRDNKRPIMSDLRDSGSIEAEAEQVWLMYREAYYKPKDEKAKDGPRPVSDPNAKEETEIIIGKNKNGPTGYCKIRFLPKYAKFVEIDDMNDGEPTGY